METWLILAIISSVFSGLSAFILKIVAKSNESSELHVLYSGLFSILIFIPAALYMSGIDNIHLIALGLAIFSGAAASVSIVFKVYALRHIDTTIYFPLFKIISPLLAILFGALFFQEKFTQLEWVGLIISLLIPLLLITRSEQDRQNNLALGILLILFTGTIASLVATLNKYITDIYDSALWISACSSLGVLLGSSLLTLHKHGYTEFKQTILTHTTKKTLIFSIARGITINIAFITFLSTFYYGGSLGIVYTITSMYILIPIVLAIFFYNEHWNLRKITAIVLSVVALGFFL